jgi:iron complex transport system ATP-binding protein
MNAKPAAVAAEGAGFRASGRWLLRDATLVLRPGEFVCIVGPNGAGKSTLLRLLAGTVRPAAGVVRWGTLGDRPTARQLAKHLSLVPQEQLAVRGFSAGEVVLMGRYVHLGRFGREGPSDFAAARTAMVATSTYQLREREVATLSGGERQRVHVARGLAQETGALLLDEPTASLDIAHQLELMALLQRLAREEGKAVAAVLHDLELAARWCDRLVVVAAGQIVADGEPETVLTRELLADVFGVDAFVYRDQVTGDLRIWFERKPSAAPAAATAATATAVHVVAGHGRGAAVIRSLVQAGFRVSVGPLSEGDRDRDVCDALGVRYLPVADAGEPERWAREEHERLARTSDVVVACDLPSGRVRDAHREVLRGLATVVAAGEWPGVTPLVPFRGAADVVEAVWQARRLLRTSR